LDLEERETHPTLVAQLQVQYPGKETVCYPIYSGENVIGRLVTSAPNTIALCDPTVSSRHAQILVHKGMSWIVDCKSTNKTRLIKSACDQPLETLPTYILEPFSKV
jgi:pSer/pThr/pTyr-binding forkhead associated (FHA) protein